MSQNLTDEIRKLVAWDKQCVVEEAKHEDSDGYFGFLTGAEWQHSQLLPIIEALLQDRERLRVALENINAKSFSKRTESALNEISIWADEALTESDARLRELLKLNPDKGE